MTKFFPLVASALALSVAAGALAQTSPAPSPGPAPAGQPEATFGGTSGRGAGPGGPSSGQPGAGPAAGGAQPQVAHEGVSLAQAIVAAEQQGGGRAVEAEFQAADRGRWSIRVLDRNGSTLRRVELDALTGQATAFETGNIYAERAQPLLPTAGLQMPTIPLGQVVVSAEQQAAGRAVGAKLERTGEGLRYLVRVATEGGERQVRIDAASGRVAPGG